MLNNGSRALKNSLILFFLGAVISLEFRLTSEVTGLISVSTGEIFVFWLLFYSMLKKHNLNIVNAYHNSSGILLPVVLYCFWAIVSLVITPDIEGFQVVRDVIVVSVFYFLLVSYVTSYECINRVLIGFVFGVMLNVVVCLPQIVFDWPRPISLDVSAANLKEALDGGINFSNVATGLFAHPNGLAPQICIAIFLLLNISTKESLIKSKVMAVSAICILLVVLYFTFAKGALLWLSLGLATLFFKDVIPRRVRLFYTMTLITSVVVVIVFFVIPYLVDEGLGGTVQTRIFLWSVLGDVVDSDFFGAVFGGNQIAMLNMSGFYSSFEYPNAHNTYLNQIVYFGFLGFVLFVWFIIRSLISVVDIDSRFFQSADRLWVAMLFLFGYIVFEPMHQSLNGLGLIYLFCGLAAVVASIGRDVTLPPKDVSLAGV